MIRVGLSMLVRSHAKRGKWHILIVRPHGVLGSIDHRWRRGGSIATRCGRALPFKAIWNRPEGGIDVKDICQHCLADEWEWAAGDAPRKPETEE
jgi:hypothetical protein